MFRMASGLIGWILVLGCMNSLLAAPVGSEAKAKSMSPAERIHKELNQVASLEILDQPLTSAINQLREMTKLNFVIDTQTLAQIGIDPDVVKVQVKLKDSRLKTGLRTILGSCNLNYVILNDIIFISSDDMTINRQMQQRVSVDVEKIDFASALKQLGRETASNLIIDPRALKDANLPVTLQVEDVPLETAVRLLCEMGGLKPVRVGNVLFVTTRNYAQEMRADPDLVPGRGPNPPGAGAPGATEIAPGTPGVPMVVPVPAVIGNPNPGRAAPANGTTEKTEASDTKTAPEPPAKEKDPPTKPVEEPARKPGQAS